MTPADSITTEVFRFSTLTITLVFVGGILAVLGGFWLIRSKLHQRGGFILIAMGAVAELLLGPCLISDHITISPTSYSMRTGFWFAPNSRRFDFKDVDYIGKGFWTEIGGKRNPQWEVHFKDGTTMEVATGNLWEANRDRITQLLRQRGVRLEGEGRHRPADWIRE